MTGTGKYKVSSFLVAKGAGMKVFPSLAEIPEGDRADLLRSINGRLSGVVLIADREGRRLLEREIGARLAAAGRKPLPPALPERVASEIALAGGVALALLLLAKFV
jgi:hypothetical protein